MKKLKPTSISYTIFQGIRIMTKNWHLLKNIFFRVLIICFLSVSFSQAAWIDQDKQMMGINMNDTNRLTFYGKYMIGDNPPSYPGDVFIWYSDDDFQCFWRGRTNIKMTYSQLNAENFFSLRNAIAQLLKDGVNCTQFNPAIEKNTLAVRYVSSYSSGSMHQSISMKAQIKHDTSPIPITCNSSVTTMAFGRISEDSIGLRSNSSLNIQCSAQASIQVKINGGKIFYDNTTTAKIEFDPIESFICRQCAISIFGTILNIPKPGSYSWAVPIQIIYD